MQSAGLCTPDTSKGYSYQQAQERDAEYDFYEEEWHEREMEGGVRDSPGWGFREGSGHIYGHLWSCKQIHTSCAGAQRVYIPISQSFVSASELRYIPLVALNHRSSTSRLVEVPLLDALIAHTCDESSDSPTTGTFLTVEKPSV